MRENPVPHVVEPEPGKEGAFVIDKRRTCFLSIGPRAPAVRVALRTARGEGVRKHTASLPAGSQGDEMKKLTLSLVGVIVLVGAASSAHAQCAFDGPSKAKGMKTSLIRAFAPCPSITFPAPNSQTGTGVPTCAKPYEYGAEPGDNGSSDTEFNAKSECGVSLTAKLESPCSVPPGDCMNVAIKARCHGITDDGVTPTNYPGYKLNIVTRATIDDRTFGDMTVINYPVNIEFPQAYKGKLSLKTDTNTVLTGLGLTTLPACSEVEIVSLSVQDFDGNIFAKLGAGTHPFDAEP